MDKIALILNLRYDNVLHSELGLVKSGFPGIIPQSKSYIEKIRTLSHSVPTCFYAQR
jgi:hypothetical protein